MEIPKAEMCEFIPDSDLRNEFHTHRTSFLLVRRQLSTGEVLTVTITNNVATASMWLKYDSVPTITFTDELTGEIRSWSTGDTKKNVYEIAMDRGIRQVGGGS